VVEQMDFEPEEDAEEDAEEEKSDSNQAPEEA
jgi:hypothetical protein